VEKNKIEIKLEAEEDIKGSSIRGSLFIFRKMIGKPISWT